MVRYFSIIVTIVENDATFAENVAICLFLSSINLMGYFMEIHFIKMGEMVLSQPKPAQIKVEVKKWVEPTNEGITCLNCGADISHQLIMVKYCTDRFRLERFYKMKKG